MKHLTKLALCLLCSAGLGLQAGDGMIKATRNKDLTAVKARLAEGEKVNDLDKDNGWTALHYAVFYEQLGIARFLLEQGADPNIQGTWKYRAIKPGATPLIIAGYYGMDGMVELLLQHGARLDFADKSGATALDYAKLYKFKGSADLLEKAATPAKPEPAPAPAEPAPQPAA
jgi:ankyrin repeat protein